MLPVPMLSRDDRSDLIQLDALYVSSLDDDNAYPALQAPLSRTPGAWYRYVLAHFGFKSFRDMRSIGDGGILPTAIRLSIIAGFKVILCFMMMDACKLTNVF